MTFKTRLTTAIATGAVLLNAIAPAALAQEITVSGNGVKSDSTVNVSTNKTTVVNQNNNSNVINNVTTTSKTGNNDANHNDGDANVHAGSASNTTTVKNQMGLNDASVTNVPSQGTNVTVGGPDGKSGNSAFSDNVVNVQNNSPVLINQKNNTNVFNNVNSKSDTGKNRAHGNDGNVTVTTGAASTTVDVATKANANVAAVVAGGVGGNDSVTIAGNGIFSDNYVNLAQNSAVILDQVNDAKVFNNVDAKAKTGKNTADHNDDGDVYVESGKASTNVKVKNAVNFNAADIDNTGLFEDVDVTVSDNGYKSDNGVNYDAQLISSAAQANDAFLLNEVEDKAKTGKNKAYDNDGDTSVKSGNIESTTEVGNYGNVNLFSQDSSLGLPSDWDFDFHFDLHGLFGFLNLG